MTRLSRVRHAKQQVFGVLRQPAFVAKHERSEPTMNEGFSVDVDVNRTAAHSVWAVRESAAELGLSPLDEAVESRVVDYGIEALIECTLAANVDFAIDVNVRAVIYARTLERISERIAADVLGRDASPRAAIGEPSFA
jgi:hypothetical protein